MKTHLSRLALLLLLGCFTLVRAGTDADIIAAVRAADDNRCSATIAAEAARLDAIFSDQLHYAHASGVIDTKASYMDSLVSGRTDYQSIDYVTREFIPAGPGVVLMKGRVLIKAGNPSPINLHDLNFLAVWREENGQWRFFAWQSCRNAPPSPIAPDDLKVNPLSR